MNQKDRLTIGIYVNSDNEVGTPFILKGNYNKALSIGKTKKVGTPFILKGNYNDSCS